jgi:hypothetical protein
VVGSTADGTAVRIDVVGSAVLVGTPDAATAGRLIADWSRCGARLQESDDGASKGVSPEFTVSGEERSFHGLATNVTMRLIGRLAGTHVMLHAAGLSTEDGRVLVLVGMSGAGKTTAAARLCLDGFGYVTDELVAMTPEGTVTAYPKPLSVVEATAGHAKHQYGPDRLGLRPAPEELSSGPFVLIERRPDAAVPVLEEVPIVEALLELLPHTSSIIYLSHPLQVLCRLLEEGGAYRLTYAEIDNARSLLSSLPLRPAPQGWAPEPEPDVTPLVWDGRYRRAPVADAVRVDGEVVTMATGAPIRILGVGVPIWEATAVPATFEDLVDAAVAAHGAHPDAAQIVEEAVGLLLESGVLHRERPVSLVDVMAGRSGREVAAASDGLP